MNLLDLKRQLHKAGQSGCIKALNAAKRKIEVKANILYILFTHSLSQSVAAGMGVTVGNCSDLQNASTG